MLLLSFHASLIYIYERLKLKILKKLCSFTTSKENYEIKITTIFFLLLVERMQNLNPSNIRILGVH